MDSTDPGPQGPLPQPTVEHLASVLTRHREELAGAGGVTIGPGEVVHALATHLWAGVAVAATACHATVDPLRLRATSGKVNCRRCLGGSRRSGAPIPGQTRLDL